MKKMPKQNKRNGEHPPVALQQKQVQQLGEIGLSLRQFRQSKELTLEQIAAKTRISQRYLLAIEEGQLDHLPEPVYIKGFIKRFADSMGCNGTALADDFPSDPTLHAIKPSWRALPAAQLRPLHLYALYIAVILLSIAGLSFLLQRPVQQSKQTEPVTSSQSSSTTGVDSNSGSNSSSDPGAKNNQTDTTTAKEAKETDSETTDSFELVFNPSQAAVGLGSNPLPGDEPIEAAQESNSSKPISVEITVNDSSWVRVVSDGKVAYEGTLDEGTKRQWEANEQLLIRSGNAGGVIVTSSRKSGGRNWQGEPLGDPGTIEEVVFNAKDPKL